MIYGGIKNTKLSKEAIEKGKDIKLNDFSSKDDKIIKVAYKKSFKNWKGLLKIKTVKTISKLEIMSEYH